jgi:hypothetical protein
MQTLVVDSVNTNSAVITVSSNSYAIVTCDYDNGGWLAGQVAFALIDLVKETGLSITAQPP